MSRPARALLGLALPVLLCLAVYWRGLNTWFLMDDYAWLGLRNEVHSLGDLWNVLFRPQAQGTVRFLSERAFFFAFSSLFGLDALPFKIWIFLTHFANLFLISRLTLRLTGSAAAAVAAPAIWTLNAALLVPLSWVSSYNQVLWASCLLAGLLAFIRYTDTGRVRWLAACWIVYLTGFGVLELNIVFPAILLLFALCCARGRWRTTIPFFIPAALFIYLHFAVIPKKPDPAYAMHYDGGLLGTFWYYAETAFGPGGLGLALLILVFSGMRLRLGDWRPAFLLGWFVLTIGPVLPLQAHRMEYYLTAPTIGLSILAAWALAEAWRAHRVAGIAAAATVVAYGVGMYPLIAGALEWRRDVSHRLRELLFAVEQTMETNPKPVLLLSGIDPDLYAAGFNDHPFRLVSSAKVYLTPGSETELKQPRHELRGVDEYVISERDAARALERNEALVLHAEAGRLRNITGRYAAIARARFKNTEQRRIDVGLPGSEEKLGPTWHAIEQGFRWMPDTGTVQLAGPEAQNSKLRMEGYVPAAVVAPGPLKLGVKIDHFPVGFVQFSRPNERFSSTFLIPNQFVGRPAITVELTLDRTLQEPDGRRLGLIFGIFEVVPPGQ